jgi:DNA-binding CsgD family transcriptional regulator
MLWVGGLMTRPDAAQGFKVLGESLSLWEQLGDVQGTARVLGSLGFLSQAIGDHKQATLYLERSLPLTKAAADMPTLARVLSGLAVSCIEAGDFERAAAVCEEGLALLQRSGDQRGIGAALANLGLIWRERGDDGRAASYWEESLAIRRAIGDLGGVAHTLTLLGGLALRTNSYARAAALYQEALVLRQRAGETDGMPLIFEGYAALALAASEPIRAVQLAAAAQSLRTATHAEASSYERDSHGRTLAELRARLDPASFERAWVAGQVLTVNEAIALALAMPLPPDSAPAGQSYGLTAREIEVLRQLTHGLTYAEIGEKLVISPRTVDAHVRAIFGKLAVNSRSAATRIAVEQRLV